MLNPDLVEAVQTGDIDSVRTLLQEPQNLNEWDEDGRPLIIWAAQEGYEDIITLLVEHGADPDQADEYGGTALQQACAEGNMEIVQRLLALGADVNLNTGQTALHGASCYLNEAVCELLLRHGANINAVDKRGWPPVYHAVKLESEHWIRFFLRHGAALDLEDYVQQVHAEAVAEAENAKQIMEQVAQEA